MESSYSSSRSHSGTATKAGLGTGAVLAMIISWSLNHSIFWALLHGILGWIYVIYYAIALR